ncbi:MAG: hypothetical protein ACJASZ_000455 [Yoonia sp.]|jgi:hypothetical protein
MPPSGSVAVESALLSILKTDPTKMTSGLVFLEDV